MVGRLFSLPGHQGLHKSVAIQQYDIVCILYHPLVHVVYDLIWFCAMQCVWWKCASSSSTEEEGHVNVSRTDGQMCTARTHSEYITVLYLVSYLERVLQQEKTLNNNWILATHVYP